MSQKERLTMKATEVLKEEHRVIEQVLDTLEAGIDRLERGGAVRPEFLLSVTDFIRGFADGCHHQKEEGVLFKRMEAQGVPAGAGPVGMMLAEHELGRRYTRELTAAAQAMEAGDGSARGRAIKSGRHYIALLRQHIYKEDNILYPMAEAVIPAGQHAAVWDDFEHVEHAETGAGVHEHYLALATALAEEIKASAAVAG
jgi:hemerythrin-like domain-containing protein